MKRIIEPITVWDGAQGVYEDAGLLIDGDRIARILSPADRASFDTAGIEQHIDGKGKLAIPGLINAHTHVYSSLARGMTLAGFSPTTFSQILEQLWWRLDKALDPEAIRWSALVGAMEAARCGVTTLIDHHASPNAISGSLDTLHEVVTRGVGLRGVFAYELSDRDGSAATRRAIEENLRFLEKAAASGPMVGAQFGLHASFTLSDETLRQVAERLPEGAGVHIHVAEGPEDEELCVRRHGQRIVHRLDRFELLRKSTILAHCLHLDEAEKNLVAEREVAVVHNPRSNMNNAVGRIDLDGILSREVVLGLGTDGLGCNMLAEALTASILQKSGRADPLAGSFDQLDALLLRNNPTIVERLLDVRVGRIEEGSPADIALLDYVPPTPLGAQTIWGHLLFGLAVHTLRVSDLLVAGRLILHDGAFVEIDEAAAYAGARESANRLWARIE